MKKMIRSSVEYNGYTISEDSGGYYIEELEDSPYFPTIAEAECYLEDDIGKIEEDLDEDNEVWWNESDEIRYSNIVKDDFCKYAKTTINEHDILFGQPKGKIKNCVKNFLSSNYGKKHRGFSELDIDTTSTGNYRLVVNINAVPDWVQ